MIEELRNARLTVDFRGEEFRIGNTGQSIILVSNLTLEWDYMICSSYDEGPLVGAAIVPYRYEVDLTKSKGAKSLDEQEFKYGPGDVDKFYVALRYPGYGIYKVWLSFNYKEFGTETIHTFRTEKLAKRVCEDFRLIFDNLRQPGWQFQRQPGWQFLLR